MVFLTGFILLWKDIEFGQFCTTLGLKLLNFISHTYSVQLSHKFFCSWFIDFYLKYLKHIEKQILPYNT